MNLPVEEVRAVQVYKISGELSPDEVDKVQFGLLDPVVQKAVTGKLSTEAFDWSVTVGFRPGVTDNVGRTSLVTIEDLVGRTLNSGARVFTETRYLFKAPSLNREKMEQIATGCLANQLIETVKVESCSDFDSAPPDIELPIMTGGKEVSVLDVNLGGTDADLEQLSKDKVLSLTLEEMCKIRNYFKENADVRKKLGLGANPTDAELEVLAQTWSEHCKHKIFNAEIRYKEPGKDEETIRSLFKTYIQDATEEIGKHVGFLVSVFHDNAGAVSFNDRWNLVYKVETHNSPSALDPYGGAITGIVGVNRDPFGTGRGAALLANVWGYCLGSPFHSGDLPQGLLHPRRIRDGVHQGVIDGGNQSGIPFMRNFEWFDPRYLGKPLVYCGTLGLMPKTIQGEPAHVKIVKPGHLIVMVGGRIGKDGIHGATFSSVELHDDSPVQAVQIGDPITQKKMTDFLLEARDKAFYTSITDNGAGGLSSSVGEMAQLCGGCEMDLAKAPLKYEGMQPWEILVSEAQERMTCAVPPDMIDDFMKLAELRDVEVSVLGVFNDSGKFHMKYNEIEVACIDMDFLHGGCPTLKLEAKWSPPDTANPPMEDKTDYTDDLLDIMRSLNVCSREYKARQYDHEVKALSVIKPFVGKECDIPADATVMMVEHGYDDGVVMAEAVNPRFSDIDTYWMTASVVDLALRRIIAAGGEPGTIAGLDNFCWPDPVESKKTPDGKYKLAQLVRACKALSDTTMSYNLPCVSGKDSMKNDAQMGDVKISIPPTLLFSAVGRISDVSRAMTPDAKYPGDKVYLLGKTYDEMGGSEYFALKGFFKADGTMKGGSAPRVYPEESSPLYQALHESINEGLVHSVHTPSLGGLAAGFALVAMGGKLGLTIDLDGMPRDDNLNDDRIALFSESNSRFIVTVDKESAASFEKKMVGLPCAEAGFVNDDGKLKIRGLKGNEVVSADISELKKEWKRVLENI